MQVRTASGGGGRVGRCVILRSGGSPVLEDQEDDVASNSSVALKFLTRLFPQVRRVFEERNALHARVAELEGAHTTYSQTRSSSLCFVERVSPAEDAVGEIAVCRALAPHGLFVVGFARSCTTITQQIFNKAPNALVLSEANFYLPNTESRFRDWYNQMHAEYGTPMQKQNHAPDFVPNLPHQWWEWLRAAAGHYEVVGDKIAFSSYHFQQSGYYSSKSGRRGIIDFFEARFFLSRYVFLIWNPIDTLISTAKLLKLEGDVALLRECDAWLEYVMLWAEWTLNFPHVCSINADNLRQEDVARMAAFARLDLTGAAAYLGVEYRTQHDVLEAFVCLLSLRDELMFVFAAVAETMHAMQRLEAAGRYGPGYSDEWGVPHPLGREFGAVEVLSRARAVQDKVRTLLPRETIATIASAETGSLVCGPAGQPERSDGGMDDAGNAVCWAADLGSCVPMERGRNSLSAVKREAASDE